MLGEEDAQFCLGHFWAFFDRQSGKIEEAENESGGERRGSPQDRDEELSSEWMRSPRESRAR